MDKETKKVLEKMRKSPIFFVERMWRLTPQPVKFEYKQYGYKGIIFSERLSKIEFI